MSSIVTDNSIAVSNPAIIYSSSDPNVVTVDNMGNIMGIGLGQAVITAKLKYHDTISDSITVTTVETLSHNYSISLTGSSTMTTAGTKAYSVKIYDNGTEVLDKSVTWSVINVDNTGTPYVKIYSFTGNSCTLKCNSSSYVGKVVRLTATLASDGTVTSSIDVTIKSPF